MAIVVALLDRLFAFCASLRLAVMVILAIASFLAVATFYEARYGADAVGLRVYGSPTFLVLMTILAINVMAAAVIRYPWKRKQTGFVITHLGILILLLGCLISYRAAVDGRVALAEGQTENQIALLTERMGVTFTSDQGPATLSAPVELWSHGGYPSLWRYLASMVWALPDKPVWPADQLLRVPLGGGVEINVLEWLPAARLERTFVPIADDPGSGLIRGNPAARLRLSGTTPAGTVIEQQVELFQLTGDALTDGITRELFNGLIEISLWKTGYQGEVDDFLNPPDPATLPGAGKVIVRNGPVRAELSCDPDAIGKPVSIGAGWTGRVVEYLPTAEPQGGLLVRSSDLPLSPVARVELTRAGVTQSYYVSARQPFLVMRVGDDGRIGHASPGGPLLRYEHPAMYAPPSDGVALGGRLQLLQGPDGVLYARSFGGNGFRSASRATPGSVIAQWMSLDLTLEEHVPAARIDEYYVAAEVAPKDLREAMRAARVELIVDGKSHGPLWLARGAAGKPVTTARGVMTVSYGFDGYTLPFSVTLLSARRIDDPGTDNPAAFESVMLISDDQGRREQQTISMNNPMTVGGALAGLTFYQSGFDNSLGQTVSTLSVRCDPGWVIKYAGCTLICLGIFLMFYMKAYFQKPVPAPATNAAKNAATPARKPAVA